MSILKINLWNKHRSEGDIMKERNIGVDLLRIIAMLMIVLLHILGMGKFITNTNNEEFYQISVLLEIICIVAVNCYVLITGYFQVNTTFKIKKLITIWIKVILYSISIYLILILFNKRNFSISECIKSFFPVITNSYWFVNCYLLLYILSPFLNKLIKNMNKGEFQKLLIVLLVVFCIFPSILPASFNLDNTAGYGIIWFIVLYFIGAYIRLHFKINYNNRINLFIYFLISVINYIIFLGIKYISNLLNIQDFSIRLYNYNFCTVFLAAIFLFLYFKNLEIKNVRIKNLISKIAPLTFAVYIIHTQIALTEVLYFDILKLNLLWNNSMQLVMIPVIAIGIFVICILIEKIIQPTIQKWIYNFLEKIYLRLKNSKCYQKIQYKMLQK